MTRFIFTLFCLLLLSARVFSQSTFLVPQNYKLDKAEDYAKYEKDIIAASKWLQETPLNSQVEKRQKTSTFVIEWVNGSPTVTVEIYEIIAEFEKKNPGMFVLYMAGCSQYVLENNFSTDVAAKQKFALHILTTVYKSGKGIEKDKKMEQLIKSEDEGTMDEWLAENLSIK